MTWRGGVRHDGEGLVSKGISGWGALTARRSRPLHARREDTLLCTHSRPSTHARATLAELVNARWISQRFCPSFFPHSLAFSAPPFSLPPPSLPRARMHVNTHTHSSRLFASLCALVTLCSFVSVCASAESEALTRAGRIGCKRALGTSGHAHSAVSSWRSAKEPCRELT